MRPGRLTLGLGLALCACGRVGYELTPERTTARDAETRDASTDGSRASGGGPPLDASAGGRGAGGASADSGSAGASGAGGSIVEAGHDASGCAIQPSPVADYCSELPALPATPIIDGALDCGLSLRPLVPAGWTAGPTPPDATADYAVAWRPDGIYYFIRVHDPSLVPADPARQAWQGDAVELYADADGTYVAPPNYDSPGSRQLVVAAPSSSSTSSARGELWAFGVGGPENWISPNFRAYGRSDGYVVEAFVTAAELLLPTLALAVGGRVGMDLSIGVSYPTAQGADAGAAGNRVGQYFLRVGEVDGGPTELPPFDPRAFCTPALVP